MSSNKFGTYKSIGGNKYLCNADTAVRWTFLGYGVYILPDGREIVFNRHYEPLWYRNGKHGQIMPADPTERIGSEKGSETIFFYNDATPNKCIAALRGMAKWLQKEKND